MVQAVLILVVPKGNLMSQDVEVLSKLTLAFPDAILCMDEIKKLSSSEQELLCDYLSAVTRDSRISAQPVVQSLINKIMTRG